MKPTICLISSAQPSANPRMLKEAKALFNSGYKVNVIWCPLSTWADELDQKLFTDFPDINWVKAGYHSRFQPLGYWYARVRQKIWQWLYKIVGNQFDAGIKSLVLFSQELTSVALGHKADLYIGHNLGALPATVKASKKHNAKSIFDFEDFHRGESHEKSYQTILVCKVENKYMPHVDIFTAASPAITAAYKSIFPGKDIITINNVFPMAYAINEIKVLPEKSQLKLFWFSQFIGMKRGLESVFNAISSFQNGEISLTLLGSCSNEMKNYFLSLASSNNLQHDQLTFLNPVEEKEIVKIASQHHIGLASEISHIANRDLCLTNKIFIYLLAGNAIILSDTNAQKDFLKTYSDIGVLYNQNNPSDLKHHLQQYIDQPELLHKHRLSSLHLAIKELNWDIEAVKWIHIVKKLTG
jgi:glycosyltransferase involved in cell wall biosynthesis